MSIPTSDARSVTFEVEGVSATVRPLRTGADSMFRGLVFRKVSAGLKARGDEWAEIADRSIVALYADAVIMSICKAGHVLPEISATADEHADGFEAWVNQPETVLDAWIRAIGKASAPVNDPALVPPALLSDDEKKSTPNEGQQSSAA